MANQSRSRVLAASLKKAAEDYVASEVSKDLTPEEKNVISALIGTIELIGIIGDSLERIAAAAESRR